MLNAMPRRTSNSDPATEDPRSTCNQIVAVKPKGRPSTPGAGPKTTLAREITRLSGKRCTHTMISELERAWDGKRRREFDAHEIAVFAAALRVPIVILLHASARRAPRP